MMHTRNILAIARKDALDILLNKTTLFFLISPIIIAVIFAIIGGLLANKSASTSLLIYNPATAADAERIAALIERAGEGAAGRRSV